MLKTKLFGFGLVSLLGWTGLVTACGDDDPVGTPKDSDDPTTTDNDTDSESTGTDTDSEDGLPPLDNFDTDQYANPEAGCDPNPEEIKLTAELVDDGAGAWVGQCTNRFGLQGAWFSYTDNNDGGNSEITMDYTGAPTGKICASGIGGLVWYDDYAKYWGAGFGVNICTTGPEDARVVEPIGGCTLYDERTKIIGFRMTVTGDQIPAGPAGADPQFRVQFAEEGRSESTYSIVPAAGTADYLFEDALVHYAVNRGDTDVPAINPEAVIALQFQVSTVVEVDTPFSLCVSDIQPILGD